jgi:septal ring factor EnvC (AmiA/AmiB activator)
VANVEDTGWFFAGVSTVIAALAGAVAMLFKLLESKNTETIVELRKEVEHVKNQLNESDRKHDECQKDRIALSHEINVIREKLNKYVHDHE